MLLPARLGERAADRLRVAIGIGRPQAGLFLEIEAAGDGPHTLRLRYEASAVNLVMASPRGASAEVRVVQDGKPLVHGQATKDTRFRDSQHGSESYVVVDSARMYFLADNHEFGEHELALECSPGIAAFAFTFTSCVDPVASALHATTVPA